MPVAEARADVRALLPWLVSVPEPHLLEGAWQEQDRASLSWGDALLVAAAKGAGCGVLLTEDLPAGQDLAGIRIVSPFSEDPPA